MDAISNRCHFSKFVTIYSFVRLGSGLPNTFIIRREVIHNGKTWFIAEQNNNIWYKLFPLSVYGISILLQSFRNNSLPTQLTISNKYNIVDDNEEDDIDINDILEEKLKKIFVKILEFLLFIWFFYWNKIIQKFNYIVQRMHFTLLQLSSETIGINMNEGSIRSMQPPNEEATKEREFVDFAPLIFHIRTHIRSFFFGFT